MRLESILFICLKHILLLLMLMGTAGAVPLGLRAGLGWDRKNQTSISICLFGKLLPEAVSNWAPQRLGRPADTSLTFSLAPVQVIRIPLGGTCHVSVPQMWAEGWVSRSSGSDGQWGFRQQVPQAFGEQSSSLPAGPHLKAQHRDTHLLASLCKGLGCVLSQLVRTEGLGPWSACLYCWLWPSLLGPDRSTRGLPRWL